MHKGGRHIVRKRRKKMNFSFNAEKHHISAKIKIKNHNKPSYLSSTELSVNRESVDMSTKGKYA